ncbi:sigma 54-interacting transcriptional regulator [Fervidibacillus halotolerans]|uniref:Sigma 54-interacting transcriptional regulator n=1 Tax=Fervidibacillus halotolerans TaxID=2980027 RepID=A0A9E8LZ59_9BACI|nr:sigma 54-interacting transcriptional regulator [Fervidibacillus halotolerans]WAA11409.1 sigma 54-interacting transcriptional regulator [Fervidibacillus halotolerans]
MQNVMVIGAGRGGQAILHLLKEMESLKVQIVIDKDPNAKGMQLAEKEGIERGTDWKKYLNDSIDIIIDVTGDPTVYTQLEKLKKDYTIIPGSIALIVVQLMKEKEMLIQKLKNKTVRDDLIFNSIHDGMIIVDKNGTITTFNKAAEKITGISTTDAVGKPVQKMIPTSKLIDTLKTRKTEINKELIFPNGKKVITTRIPIIDEKNQCHGAFAVFKDITEVVQLASEITNLKEIQTMLEAIIYSSNDAISVVDENGRGLLINPAYTRLTGLTESDVYGQPATIDISEGESMHYHVLKTKKPVRGVKMKVGPKKREVIVNVAPIIVDNQLKGSVGVIHDMSEIKSLMAELEKAKERIRSLEAKYTFDDIIGHSEEMMIAKEQAKIGAKTPATVLLQGESGTGKELFAHAIHNESDRKYNKFVRVNCAAISDTLLESELFGYEEGAFSGAKRGGKKGFFEEANNGSIFLDEIGEMQLSTQAKLLRVLQEKEIIKVGGTKPIPINVRIIAATNKNLEKEVAKGNFREDLYYRLNRIPIHIPPLRDRKEDLPALCDKIIEKINRDYGRKVKGITKAAIDYLSSYHWPGNVRELENILGRAIIFMEYNESYIDTSHLPRLNDFDQSYPTKENSFHQGKSLPELVEEYEKRVITEILKKHGGNKTRAAEELGVSIRNLYYKLEKYSL